MSVAFAFYEPDTIVADPDENPAEAREVDVRGVEMPEGFDPHTWHRQMVFGRTACGLKINYRLVMQSRNRQYDGVLCDVCFTQEERDEAELANMAQEEKTR